MTYKKEKWEKGFEKTKFAKGGGCCFECCDYEGMYNDLKDFIRQLLETAKQQERARIMKELREWVMSGKNQIEIDSGNDCWRQWVIKVEDILSLLK